MSALNGARVALLESRRRVELSELVRRLGGVPCAAPALRERHRPHEVPGFIDALSARQFSMVIFLTGVGASTLLREAERLARLDETLCALRASTVVCRGPKPENVLTRYRVPVRIKAPPPYTTKELLHVLSKVAVDRQRIAVVHYGERNQELTCALEQRGGCLDEFCLYEWLMPEDQRPLDALVDDVIEGRVDAIAFTSQIQCRHLFAIAERGGRLAELRAALQTRLIVAA